MRHRIFIAVNLPEGVKKSLWDYREKWPELPARWTKEENLHITLIFIGDVEDQDVMETCNTVKEVAERHQPFSVNLNKICYGPHSKTKSLTGRPAEGRNRPPYSETQSLTGRPAEDRNRPPEKNPNIPHRPPDSETQSLTGRPAEDRNRPRMVWAEGEKSKELAQLKDDLENSLAEKVRFEQENRAFSPHITLARINGWKLKDMEPEEIPEINEDVSFDFAVNSVEVMESTLKRGGAEYVVLESIPFSNTHEYGH